MIIIDVSEMFSTKRKQTSSTTKSNRKMIVNTAVSEAGSSNPPA